MFYGKFRLFLSISDLEQKPNITFGKSGFGKPVKNDFYSSRETFWRKQIFENFYESDLFLILGIKRLAGWSNCLYVSSGTVMESCTFWGKWKFFLSFPHIMWNIFATSNEIGRVVNLAFIISSRTFWGKRSLNETVFRFSPSFDYEQKTLGRGSHLLPTRRGALFGGEPYFEMVFFFNLADWFLVELRTAIYVFRRTFSATSFWKSVFCFDSRTLSKNLVRHFTKCFRQFFRTDILLSRWTNWEDKCFMEKSDFSYQFPTLSNNVV